MRFFLSLLFAGSAAQAAGPLYPLKVGNRWTYKVSSTYPGCPNGDQVSEVLRTISIAGRTALEVQGACVKYAPGALTAAGDKVDVHYNGDWYRTLDEPVTNGHQWVEFRANATWKNLGSQTVAAGTFSDCWRKVRSVSYTDWSDYCRGVGLVRSHMVDLGGGYIDLELKSFSLK